VHARLTAGGQEGGLFQTFLASTGSDRRRAWTRTRAVDSA